MRTAETRVGDLQEIQCSRIAVVGDPLEERWIHQGDALWKVGPPTADQLEMRMAGRKAAVVRGAAELESTEEDASLTRGADGEEVLSLKLTRECQHPAAQWSSCPGARWVRGLRGLRGPEHEGRAA